MKPGADSRRDGSDQSAALVSRDSRGREATGPEAGGTLREHGVAEPEASGTGRGAGDRGGGERNRAGRVSEAEGG